MTTPTATTPGATTPGATPPAGTPAATDNTYTGKIPGQPAGTTIEYYIRATGTKAGAAVTQALPAAGETGALTFTVGAAASSNGVGLKVPQTDGPLIGYSLRSIETTQQIKRTFTLNKAEAATFHYHPGGALSANHIGPAFDASKQVTRVALGQGPFKLIEIKMQAGFDFDKYAVKTAVILGFTGDRIEQVRLGGELHDIGKIGTREAVLNKPGPLTPDEFEHIKVHVTLGERILAPFLSESPNVLRIVRSHHERMDGEGFPDHLRADEIPIEARIVAVVDAFDAMTTNRAYRPPRTPEEAVEELRCSAGPQFDRDVVHAFLTAFPDAAALPLQV